MVRQDPANILILGASYAGISVAHQFLRRTIHELRRTKTAPRYKVILVSPNTEFYYNVGAPRAICSANLIPDELLFTPFLDGFGIYPEDQFEFIQGEASALDVWQRTVDVKVAVEEELIESKSKSRSKAAEHIQTFTYHALIIATGAAAHSSLLSLHGNQENTVYALERFREHLTVASNVVIVGGGPSGIECAGQIATYVNQRQLRHRSTRKSRTSLRTYFRISSDTKATSEGADDPPVTSPSLPDSAPIKITLLSGHDRLLPSIDASVGTKAERMLRKLGVNIIHNVRLISAQELPGRATRCVLTHDLTISCDLFIAATGVTPNTEFIPEEFLDATGYVVADQFMRVPRAGERVYAIGSCCAIDGKSLMDVLSSIPVLLHNVKNDLVEWEIKMQKPNRGRKTERLSALRDIPFKPDSRVTTICPLTRWGGVGVLSNRTLPSLAVWWLKGRDYNIGSARKVAFPGQSLYHS